MRVVQTQNLKDMEEFQAVLEGFVLKYLWNEMYSNYVTWIRTFTLCNLDKNIKKKKDQGPHREGKATLDQNRQYPWDYLQSQFVN